MDFKKIGLVEPVIVILSASVLGVGHYLKMKTGLSDASAQNMPVKKMKSEFILPDESPVFKKCRRATQNINISWCENDFVVCIFNKTDINCIPRKELESVW